MKERRCATCAAFARTNHEQGTCRAKPPVAIPQMSMNPVANRPELRLLSGFPPVGPDDWCMDWRPHERATH